jgi:hypothetical protein
MVTWKYLIHPLLWIFRVIAAREMYGERNVRRLLVGATLPSIEYEKEKELEREVMEAMVKSRAEIVERRCAERLQSQFRRIRDAKLARLRRREVAAANRIQRRLV